MELRDYLVLLRRRKRIVILVTLLVVGTAVTLSILQTPIYRSTSQVLLERDRSVFGPSGASAADPGYVQTEMQVMESEPVRALVKEKLGTVPKVATRQVGTTAVVQVSAESPTPRFASAAANAYVEAYITYKGRQEGEQADVQVRELEAQIDALQKQIDDLSTQLNAIPSCATPNAPPVCSQRDSLQQDRDALISQQAPFKQKLDQLRVDTRVGASGARVVRSATVPDRPVRPAPLRNGILALGAGLLLGIGAAAFLEYLDDSIDDRDDVGQVAPGLPVLGVIPADPSVRGGPQVVSLLAPRSPSAEAYRTLRTGIRFLAVDRPMHRIQLTSPNAGEGKSTTAANLAVALARAGERVVLVSCDLRRPRVHEFFGLSNDVGLTSVLLGDEPLSASLQEVPNEDRLSLLASGPLPPNPSELLSSSMMGEVLKEVDATAEFVIMDCPPVLPVTDAAVLSSWVDGTLLVVKARSTTGKQMARAMEMLRQVDAPLLGAVLNDVRVEGTDQFGYNYYARPRPGRSTGEEPRERLGATVPDGQGADGRLVDESL